MQKNIAKPVFITLLIAILGATIYTVAKPELMGEYIVFILIATFILLILGISEAFTSKSYKNKLDNTQALTPDSNKSTISSQKKRLLLVILLAIGIIIATGI